MRDTTADQEKFPSIVDDLRRIGARPWGRRTEPATSKCVMPGCARPHMWVLAGPAGMRTVCTPHAGFLIREDSEWQTIARTSTGTAATGTGE